MEIKAMTKQDLFGRKVISLIELSNDWCSLPPGTKYRITNKWNGLTMLSEPCKCCGVQITMFQVDYNSVKLL